MGKKRKKLKGTVQKIIQPLSPSEPEKAQIESKALRICIKKFELTMR
jgi:hypothetical protein